MTLYKLPFAIFPVKEVYARSRDDIAAWLRWYEQNPFEFYARSGRAGTLADVVEVKKGELRFDFGGIVSGSEYAYIDVLPDFTAKIRLESIPYFPAFQSRLREQKVGDLYMVQNFDGGMNPLSYVPEDVFNALRKCDISQYERQAENHIKRLNKALAGGMFTVAPRATKKEKIN